MRFLVLDKTNVMHKANGRCLTYGNRMDVNGSPSSQFRDARTGMSELKKINPGWLIYIST